MNESEPIQPPSNSSVSAAGFEVSSHISKLVCECQSGWGGPACSLRVCADECHHGVCDPTTLKCDCDAGWKGKTCSEPVCLFGCNGRGTCTLPGKCTCDAGYEGNDCAEEVSPPVAADSDDEKDESSGSMISAPSGNSSTFNTSSATTGSRKKVGKGSGPKYVEPEEAANVTVTKEHTKACARVCGQRCLASCDPAAMNNAGSTERIDPAAAAKCFSECLPVCGYRCARNYTLDTGPLTPTQLEAAAGGSVNSSSTLPPPLSAPAKAVPNASAVSQPKGSAGAQLTPLPTPEVTLNSGKCDACTSRAAKVEARAQRDAAQTSNASAVLERVPKAMRALCLTESNADPATCDKVMEMFRGQGVGNGQGALLYCSLVFGCSGV